jgi:dUTPase
VEIVEYARKVAYISYTQATPESQKTNRVGGFGSTGV